MVERAQYLEERGGTHCAEYACAVVSQGPQAWGKAYNGIQVTDPFTEEAG
jgi:hypothetical protein